LQKQADAIRDLASRAEVRAEQSIRKIAGYFQQKTTELRALNRSMEETRIQLIAQIDQLQELKEQLNFNHAAAQNGEPLNGAQTSLAHLQALTADAQRVANDLDSFGANPSVTGKPADGERPIEAAKRR
jgi:cell division protein ZapA (FtsZ GTPase activity inhibitor)